jgi:hypothetical protein
MATSTAAAELEQLRGRRRKLAAHAEQMQADLRKAVEDLAEAQRGLAQLEAQAPPAR